MSDPPPSVGEEPEAPARPRHPKASVRSVLDAPRSPVARYRPVVLAAFGGGVIVAVGAAFIVAFGGDGGRARHREDAAAVPPEPGPASEITDRLPARYDDPAAAPRPGSAGPPPVKAQPIAPVGASAPATGPSQAQQEALAARASSPFFGGTPPRPPPDLGAGVGAGSGSGTSSAWPAGVQTTAAGGDGTSDKERFISRSGVTGTALTALPRPALSPFEVKAGTIIPAALVTGLESDLPGMVIAQVTEPVFDHQTGRTMLIPQGARLIGKYDSQVSYGQSRALVVFTRLIFPNGRSVDLGAMVGADPTGAGGLADRVDTHLPRLARAVGLSTLISIGASAAQNSAARGAGDRVLLDATSGVAGTASQTGQRLVDRDLQRAPTLKVRPGFPLRVLVDKDLVLPPE
ncbi:TrbI/VirB10 family protein [Caulobacter segnis]